MNTQNTLDQMFTITDANLNNLVCKNGQLNLVLFSEQKTRNIGNLVQEDGKLFYVKHMKEKNTLQKTNSWGFQWEVLKRLPDDAMIIVFSELARYRINAKEAKTKGHYLHFKKVGFERQFFIPKNCFEINRIIA